MDKLKMGTTNFANQNYHKLAEMFPNAITETVDSNGHIIRSIDADVLEQEINSHVVKGREERYQFTWPGKRQAMLIGNIPTSSTLRPCIGESTGRDGTRGSFDSENLYIEGDNLEVLKLLQETYLGKVKMIYIDPPYNTGSDFVYSDNYTQGKEEYISGSGQYDENGGQLVQNLESNGRFHTDWLNMIYPRIKLAKNLLSDNGLIFISTDENEATNLRKTCDEVFGSTNFVGQITVVGNPRGRDYGGIARMHDYILTYQKSPSAYINLITDENNEFKMYDNLGGFELRELRNRNVKFNKENRPNLYYPFYVNTKEEDANGLHPISLEPVAGWLKLYPLESQGVCTVWRWGQEKSLRNLNVNIMAKPMRNGSYMIVEKYREAKRMARSVWWDKNTNTEKGTLLVKEIFGGKVFDYPKPVEMLMRLCEMGTTTDENNIVLDFFSGSATTAHAVMQLNAEDGGNRKFIMVQLPEETPENSEARKAGYKNICEIGKERIRRAGAKIKEETGADIDYGFRILKCDSSNMKPVYYAPADTEQEQLDVLADNIKEGRTGEDLLFQVMLELGVPLSSTIESIEVAGQKIFDVGQNYLLACFDLNVTEASITEIAKRQPAYFVMRDRSMANDTVAANFEQIFRMFSPHTVRKVL